jgi:hypothetical protein
MKKVILSLITVGALSIVSCKKNYNCVCTIAQPGFPYMTTTTVIDDTKSKATTTCTALANSAAGVSSSCAIQ